MKDTVMVRGRPVVAKIAQDPKTGRWEGVVGNGDPASADTKEELIDALGVARVNRDFLPKSSSPVARRRAA